MRTHYIIARIPVWGASPESITYVNLHISVADPCNTSGRPVQYQWQTRAIPVADPCNTSERITQHLLITIYIYQSKGSTVDSSSTKKWVFCVNGTVEKWVLQNWNVIAHINIKYLLIYIQTKITKISKRTITSLYC